MGAYSALTGALGRTDYLVFYVLLIVLVFQLFFQNKTKALPCA